MFLHKLCAMLMHFMINPFLKMHIIAVLLPSRYSQKDCMHIHTLIHEHTTTCFYAACVCAGWCEICLSLQTGLYASFEWYVDSYTLSTSHVYEYVVAMSVWCKSHRQRSPAKRSHRRWNPKRTHGACSARCCMLRRLWCACTCLEPYQYMRRPNVCTEKKE